MAFFKLNDDSLLVSLDLGFYQTRCSIFRKSAQYPLELLSFVEKKTEGLGEDLVSNFESLSLALSSVLTEAEEKTGSYFSEVWLGISPSFYSMRCRGMAALSSRQVRAEDVDLALKTARAVPLPSEDICLHSLPQFFEVDGQGEISQPLGLSGLRLETEVFLLAAPEKLCRDIVRSLKVLGYNVKSVFHNLPSFAYSMTSSDQKSQGSAFVDIGEKTTRALIFKDSKIKKVFSFPLGGFHFTKALSQTFHISMEQASLLKEKHAQLLFDSYDETDTVLIPDTEVYVSKKLFIQTLEKKAEELLSLLKKELEEGDLKGELRAGYVLTGATSHIPGFLELAQFHLGGEVSYPTKLYENDKQRAGFSLIEMAYLENKIKQEKSPRMGQVFRDLF